MKKAKTKPKIMKKIFWRWSDEKQTDFLDRELLFLVLFLVAFGLVIVYSTSAYTGALSDRHDPALFLKRQGAFAVVGIVGMLVVSEMDYHIWKRASNLLILFSLLALVYVLVKGVASHGAKRWIGVGSFQFQPSEVAKIAIIIYTAHKAQINSSKLGNWKEMVKVAVLPFACIILIAVENLSTAIICSMIVLMILFVTSPRILPFVVAIISVAVAMVCFLFAESYRLDRIDVWFHPEKYANGKGYQTLQALYAIGSGGVFGKGLGQSIQKLGFIPESHNDYVFSVICEELGLFGAACVIGIFLLLIWRCAVVALNAPDLFGALVVIGVITHVAVQAGLNIAVVTKVAPPTGVPLPFISYGGTALLMLMGEMGLVLSVSRQLKIPKGY